VPDYYFVEDNRAPLGPLSLTDVVEMHRTGSLRDGSLLTSDGGTTTRTVEELLVAQGFLPAKIRAPRCAACNAPLAPDAKWCTECGASARDFVSGTLATPGRRLLAALIDGILPSGFGITLGARAALHHPSMLATLFTLAFGIYACVLYSRGTTPGKNVLGMEVLDGEGDPAGFWHMIAREWLAKPISGLIFGLGYFWILIDNERQGWHDKLCGTHVVVREGEHIL
jgi:uncharacterized RDD family membrane protein YckC